VNLGDIELPPVQRRDARLTVLDVTKWFGETSGGVRTYLLEKSAFVNHRSEYRQVLVTPGPEDSISESPGVRWYRLRGPRIPTQPQYRFLLATSSLRRIIEHEQPDVIEVGSQLFVPWVTRLAVRRRRTPLIGFYHGNLERNVAFGRDAPLADQALRRRLMRRYVRMVDGLFAARIAGSASLAADLAAAGVHRVTRVPLGVDLTTFHPRRRDSGVIVRERLGVPAGERLVIYAGRIAPEKRIDVALRAWPGVAALTGATLALVGDGPLIQRYQSLYGHSHVRWLPFERDRNRLAELLASADVYLAPGPIETFGLSALEALACGTPVLAVDAGGGAELVARSRAGAVYAPGSSDSLTSALASLLASDLAPLGERARELAEREHGWDRVFETLFDLYATVAAR
jgi:alpha-1,6-mannosyltransferase